MVDTQGDRLRLSDGVMLGDSAYRCIDDCVGGGREGLTRGAMDRRGARSRRAHRGRTPNLSVPDMPDIFVIGDLASVTDNNGKPVPGIAPAAKQMGRYVGRLIAARVAGRTDTKPFAYSHAGDLATVGRRAAVVKIGRFELTGFLGWLFWGVAHIYFLIGLRNRFVVAVTWLWSYLTFRRGARLISMPEETVARRY